MPELIRCTACGRQLQLPESLMGQAVQCPSCQATFVASMPGAPPAPPFGLQPPPASSHPSQPQPEPQYPPPRDRYGRDDYGPQGYDRDNYRRDAYDPGYRGPGRYDGAPHRGSAVLTLGILSLVFSLCPIVGFVLGLIAVTLGSSDLTAMDSGNMDPEGRGSTVAGRTCGLIGLILSGVFFFLGLMVQLGRFR
jgi:hypothetical protein